MGADSKVSGLKTVFSSKSCKVIACTCQHKGQDAIHGKGMRVMNECRGTSGKETYRCTVCVREVEWGF